MKLRGSALVLVLAVLTACGDEDKFASMTCGELRDVAESALLDLGPNASGDAMRQAIKDENAARDRMDELGCFDR